MPANIKTAVAIIERFDSLLIPQMPCPLVQPDPSRVPKPTSIPARISTEPYRVCRRVNILRDYPDDKIKIYP